MPSDMNSESKSLKDQVALVTGSGRGIGRAAAIALAQDGASIALTARTLEQLEDTQAAIRDLGGAAEVFTADMGEVASIAAMIQAAEARLGPIDLLVNNAAATGTLGPTWEADPVEWWRCFEVNVRGPFICTHAVLPGMISRGRGRIINVASGAGTAAIPYMNAYATSKTALMRFSEALALEVASHGVQVFSIDPGAVHTALSGEALHQPAIDQWMPWFRELFESERVVPPENAARLIVRLASGEADALSGRYISVYHDVDRMISEADAVRQEGLYVLRVPGLPE